MSEATQEPSVTAADDDLLASLADEFGARLRRGESATADEYAARHPHLADRIRNALSAIAMIEGARAPDPLPATERPGATVGRYKLLERIGEGGFGVVYMAEQLAPVRRKVALKIVKPGMDSRQVLARFDAERQALAIMDHPNIAKVFDGGMTEAGRPYFVMELVKGEPITSYCDANQLPPRQRLELFVQVCDAVQHAHQKGIIHRDIKPTNVLVAVHDTTPVVKVIDFGVAKALGQELTERTLFTGFAQLVGTPLYMSPEQAGHSALDVDTRSDIYSLGVLLYELLTGTTPFDKERFRKAAQEEIRRIIREEEPPRPSTRLIESKDSLASISAQRHTEPAKLTKLVRGELDWIVMKALEKDRARRYETANGLARDVQRYLHDEPVSACPPSGTYRLRKFTRRYRIPLAVAAGFLSLLLVGIVVSTYQAIRIRAEQQNTLAQKAEVDRQRQRAEQERDRAVAAEQKAVTEAHKSEQVAAFMTDMLRGVGPSVARGRDTAMLREILDNTTKRLDQLQGQPAVEADLRRVLGDVYYELGDYPASEAMRRRALTLRRDLVGAKHPDVAKTLVNVAESIRKQDRLEEAERMFNEALAMQRELLGDSHPNVAFTLYSLGMVHNRARRGAEAEAFFREALSIYRQHPKQDVAVIGQLALSLTYQGKYAEAEPLARESLADHRALAPNGSPAVAYALFNLGVLLRQQGRNKDAEPYFREALEIRRKQLPPLHIDTLTSIHNHAWSLIDSGRSAEAVPLIDEFVRARATNTAVRGNISSLITARLSHFRNVKDAAGCRESAEMWERLNPATPGELYNAACYRAVTAAVIRATDSSPEAAKRAAEEGDRAMTWLGKALAAGYGNIKQLRRDQDLGALGGRADFKELLAERESDGLSDLTREVERDPKNPKVYRERGLFLGRAGRFGEAVPDFEKALELDRRNQANWYDLATLHLALGNVDEYRRACQQMLDRFEKRDDPIGAERTAKTCSLAPDSVADFSRVERVAERCLAGTEEHRFRRWFVLAKALTEYRAGRHEQAIDWLGKFGPKAGGSHSDATAFAVLAMAHHHLRHADQARQALDASRAIIARKRPESEGPDAWHDWLHAEILCREAEQLLGNSSQEVRP